jgi:hypothetical protein
MHGTVFRTVFVVGTKCSLDHYITDLFMGNLSNKCHCLPDRHVNSSTMKLCRTSMNGHAPINVQIARHTVSLPTMKIDGSNPVDCYRTDGMRLLRFTQSLHADSSTLLHGCFFYFVEEELSKIEQALLRTDTINNLITAPRG